MYEQLKVLESARRAGPGPARLEGRAADRRAAPPARGDAGRRRLRDLDPRRTLPLPAGTVRARLPGRLVLQAEAKPKSKVLILDANPDVTSKAGLFKKAWAEEYKGIVEYRPNHVLTDVDVAHDDREVRDRRRRQGRRAQRAAAAARRRRSPAPPGVITANNRWCDVDFLTFESIKVKDVHVLGDCDPDRAGHAQVRPHGQPARQGVRRGGGSSCSRAVRPARRRC